jgi:hypothetical protein
VHVSAHAQRSSASLRAPFRGAGREEQAWDLGTKRAARAEDVRRIHVRRERVTVRKNIGEIKR